MLIAAHVNLKLKLCLHSAVASFAVKNYSIFNEFVTLNWDFYYYWGFWEWLHHSPNVSAALTKLFWYFVFTNSFEIPGYVWNLCLFFLCFFDARWASQEHIDWQLTLQWEQLYSFRSFATIWWRAFWISLSWNFEVNSMSSSGGKSGWGTWFVPAGCIGGFDCCCWFDVCGTEACGGATTIGIGLYLLAFSTCRSLVTCNSHSSNFLDRYPQIRQFKSIDRVFILVLSWFLCFLKRDLCVSHGVSEYFVLKIKLCKMEEEDSSPGSNLFLPSCYPVDKDLPARWSRRTTCSFQF